MASTKTKNKMIITTLTEEQKESLLASILQVQSCSKQDQQMIDFIKSFISKAKLVYEEDAYGNIYVRKGLGNKTKQGNIYPCFVCHIDTVHDLTSKEEVVVTKIKDNFLSFRVYQGVYDSHKQCGKQPVIQQIGTGGDDKVGIFTCLAGLLELENLKVCFFRDEEIGCVGSKNATMSFFEDCSFVLQTDRQMNNEFITGIGSTELSSEEFLDDINEILDTYGYIPNNHGGITDVGALKQKGLGVCCANMSSGYYFPHRNTEFVHIPSVMNVYNMMKDIVKECGNHVYKHEYKGFSYPDSFPKSYSGKTYQKWDNPKTKEAAPQPSLPFKDLVNPEEKKPLRDKRIDAVTCPITFTQTKDCDIKVDHKTNTLYCKTCKQNVE